MSEPWDATAPGVMTLPSGRVVRGRGLRNPLPAGPLPEFGVYLLRKRPMLSVPWEYHWVPWRDFWVPAAPLATAVLLRMAWEKAETQRVEIACGGGKGRTGTALACIAVLDGVPRSEAVAYVRANYHRRAVETPWQRRFVKKFQG